MPCMLYAHLGAPPQSWHWRHPRSLCCARLRPVPSHCRPPPSWDSTKTTFKPVSARILHVNHREIIHTGGNPEFKPHIFFQKLSHLYLHLSVSLSACIALGKTCDPWNFLPQWYQQSVKAIFVKTNRATFWRRALDIPLKNYFLLILTIAE
jgi:hypothetical protein